MCYKGILGDIEQMIQEGWLRVLTYHDHNTRKAAADMKRVFYPCDLQDPIELKPLQLGKRCHNYIA